MNLSPPMRAALEAAKRDDGLRRVHNPDVPGRPQWPAHHTTLAALVRHELVKRDRLKNRRGRDVDIWTITTAGRQALEPEERFVEQRDRFLQRDVWRGGDYTTDRHRAVDDLPTNHEDLNPRWEHAAARQHADAQDRKTVARKLARNLRRAA